MRRIIRSCGGGERVARKELVLDSMLLQLRFAGSGHPAWWAKLTEHYDEKQKDLAVLFADDKLNEIRNPGHHKIVSDLLDSGEWQKAAKAALLAYYCKDTSTEVFEKVLEAPLGEAEYAVTWAKKGYFIVESEDLRDAVARAIEDSQWTPQQQLYGKYHSDLTQLQVHDSLWIMDKETQRNLLDRNVPTDRRIPLPVEAALLSFPPRCVLLLAGESGSGKTWHMLSSLPPFFCPSGPTSPFHGRLLHDVERADYF